MAQRLKDSTSDAVYLVNSSMDFKRVLLADCYMDIIETHMKAKPFYMYPYIVPCLFGEHLTQIIACPYLYFMIPDNKLLTHIW